ncbi:MAG: PKD domain-containing protein [Verrucomicrobia bacterium]|nr:PKD domain-containing protein [Verrucomicrobiota bacterium]
MTPASGQPPLVVTFNPAASNHPHGLALVYEWDMGDGTTFTRQDNSSFTHTFGAGTFRPTLVVRDSNGGFDAMERTVTSRNNAPVAVVDFSLGGGEAPLTVAFSGDGSSDPDGDDITFLWNFGDGHTSTEANPVHTFTTPGDYTVTLTVTDALGASQSAQVPSAIRVRDMNNPIAALNPLTLPPLQRGLEYHLYFNDVESGTGRVPFFLTPDLIPLEKTGIIDNLFIWHRTIDERFTFRYRGYIDIPVAGVYTFYAQSHNGMQVNIAGQQLIRDNTRYGHVNAWGTLSLAAGLHAVDIIYYGNVDAGGGTFNPYLNFTWSGPDFGRRRLDSQVLYWSPGRPQADFIHSIAPDSPASPVVHNFDAAISRVFGDAEIVSYQWQFPGGVIKTGRTVSHPMVAGDNRVVLTVTTSDGISASTGKNIFVPPTPDFVLAGGVDRSLMPGKIITSRGQFLPNGLATGAFDGDKSTRWLDLSLTSWIQIEYRHKGIPQPYVVSEYRFTSLTAWNERDPISWRLYGSNDGIQWDLLDVVTNNSFSGPHPRTNVFPINNVNAYSIYRFEDIQATGTGSSPDATGLNLIELIDYGIGNQPSSVPPIAQFVTSSDQLVLGQSIHLNGASSYDPDGYPLYYHWDFGDGQTRQGWELNAVDYTYSTQGQYTVLLTVRDALGQVASTTRTIEVTVQPNAAPVATYSFTIEQPTGRSRVLFDASASFDPDGDPLTFFWEFGDGVTATGPVVEHIYAVGIYEPMLIVMDDRGGRTTFAQEVIIGMPEDPPLSIGINIAFRGGQAEDRLLPGDIAGLLPQTNWNNTNRDRQLSVLVDANGDPTTMGIEFIGPGGTYNGANVTRSADHRLMQTGAGGPIVLRNVPYASYDVYVYHGTRRETHERDEVFWIRLTSPSRTEQFFVRQDSFVWGDEYRISTALTAEAAVQDENVVVFSNITDRTVTLSAGSLQSRTQAHAIQIVDTSGGIIIPPTAPPSTPSNLAATPASSSEITLTWSPVDGLVDGYRIQRAPAGSSNWSQVGEVTANTFTNTGLAAGTTYQYRVAAFNTGGNSDWSTAVSATTETQVSIPPTTPQNLTATATSAGSVSSPGNRCQARSAGIVLNSHWQVPVSGLSSVQRHNQPWS